MINKNKKKNLFKIKLKLLILYFLKNNFSIKKIYYENNKKKFKINFISKKLYWREINYYCYFYYFYSLINIFLLLVEIGIKYFILLFSLFLSIQVK
jgi:hypothetical protein